MKKQNRYFLCKVTNKNQEAISRVIVGRIDQQRTVKDNILVVKLKLDDTTEHECMKLFKELGRKKMIKHIKENGL